MPNQAGTIFGGRFRIDALAGRGGMGEVYRATDTHTGGAVALKLLHSGSTTDTERFSREAQVLAQLRHPGIVSHIAHGETEEGELYLAMEWLDGEDLAHRLGRQPLSLRDALTLFQGTADALQTAHRHGILHRDLKPSNLFLRGGSVAEPVVLDFGIARQRAAEGLTRTGAVLGTPAYMAPEQARGQRDLGPAVDIFALGCMLFECLAGKPPFCGDHLPAVLTKILFEPHPSLLALRPGTPLPIVELLDRMLDKDPERRPPDAGALSMELQRLLLLVQGWDEGAHAPSPLVVTAAAVEETEGDSYRTAPFLPFLGRDTELSILERVLADSIDEPSAGAAIVVAPAGMGKSRLRHELLRRLEERAKPPLVLLGRCDPLGAGTPFGAIGQAVRRLCGVQMGEPIERRREKLRLRIGRALSPADSQRVAEFVGELCGISFPDLTSPKLRAAHQSPPLMAEQVTQALLDFLSAECRSQPVVLMLEDMHWGDAPTVRLIEAALRELADLPLFVLALGRSELTTRFPQLWRARGAIELRLGTLGPRVCERLTQQALTAALGRPAPAESVTRIVERAGGNPLFLEELVRAVCSGREDSLPDTVLAILAERIQALEPGLQRLLKAASVFGDTFVLSGVQSLLLGLQSPSLVDGWLRIACDQDLIELRRKGRAGGEPAYRFRHALMRDALYARLDAAERIAAHARAAAWLEQAGEPDALVLAEHYLRGEEPGRAVSWLHRATEQALEGSELTAAIERGERAITAGAAGSLRGSIRRLQATAAFWQSDYRSASELAAEAVALLPAGGAEWFLALGEAVAACGRLAMLDRVERCFDLAAAARPASDAGAARIICLSRACFPLIQNGRYDRVDPVLATLAEEIRQLGDGDALALAQALQVQAERAHHSGDAARAVELLAQAIVAFERAGDKRSALTESNSLAASYVELGLIDLAEAICRRNIEQADKNSTPRAAAFARFVLSYVLIYRPELAAEQRQLAVALIAEYRGAHSVRMEGLSHLLLAIAELHDGSVATAEAEARAAAELLSDYPGVAGWAQAVHAQTLLGMGRIDEALRRARASYELLEQRGSLERGQSYAPLALCECLLAAGQRDTARQIAIDARRRLLERASRISRGDWHESFLRLQPHRRTLELYAELVGGTTQPSGVERAQL